MNFCARFFTMLFLGVVSISSYATAATIPPACKDILNYEMSQLGLGAMNAPAPGATIDPRDPNGVSRRTGDSYLSAGIVPVLDHYLVHVESPSLIFGSREQKEITLDKDCKVSRVDFTANGIGWHVNADICKAVALSKTAGYADQVRAYLQKSIKQDWAKCDDLFARGVQETCSHYKPTGSYSNDVPVPPTTGSRQIR